MRNLGNSNANRNERFAASAVTVLFSLWVAQVASAAEVSQTAKKTVWVIDQYHHSTGQHQISFTPDAVKICNNNFGYKLLAKAPVWDVCVYRDDDKIMCKLSRRAYYGEQGFDPKRPKINTNPIIANQDVCKIKTKVYRGPHHDDWVAHFPGVPHDVEDMITAFFKSQEVDGVVLRSVRSKKQKANKTDLLSFYVDEQKAGTRLDTLNIRSVPYKASDFEIPANLRKTANIRAVTTSASGRQEAESIIEQMGLGEKLGSKRK